MPVIRPSSAGTPEATATPDAQGHGDEEDDERSGEVGAATSRRREEPLVPAGTTETVKKRVSHEGCLQCAPSPARWAGGGTA